MRTQFTDFELSGGRAVIDPIAFARRSASVADRA
jgi:hypothetical protein